MMTAGYANAGPGIFINDGTDDGCIVTSDESIRRNALFFLVNNNLEWAAGQASGGNMPSVNAFRDKCRSGDAASQTNRALFYGDAGGAGSKHLSLGGRLDVNSGIIGLGDRAAGNNSIRIGSGNTLQAANSQSNSVAIGNDVETKAALAVGIGSAAKANGVQSVAVGNSVESSGYYSVAIGTSARANAAQTVALGNNANAAGEDALAIGRSANAQAKDSIAFGRSSQAAAKGVAIGSDASAAVANSVALGSGTTAVAATNQSGTKNVNGLNYTYVGDSANSSVTVGNRQIKQVGAGEVSAASTDAINGSQLYATQNVIGNIGKGVATNLGGGAALKPDGTFTAPTYNLTDANGNAVSKNNVGDALNVLDSRLNTVGGGFQVAAATGTTQTVKPGNTLKFIDGTNTTTEVSTDGAGVTTVKINATAVALTNNATTGQVNAPTAADANKAATAGSVAAAINTAVGKSGFNVEGGSVAGGTATGTATSRVNNNDTVKLQAGKNIALVQNGKEFTFGTVEEMEVTSIKAGTAGADAKLDRDGLTITSTSSGDPVKLTNNGLNNGGHTIVGVAAGAVNATSTDAVNGSQLYKTANSTATHLGGGSAVQADGSISAPTYTLANATGTPTNYSNVGDALTALNARTNAANAGWKFQVNSGAAETIKPNDTVGFKDGTNIAITNNGKDITIATKPNLTADSLTINNGPVINGNGISTNGKNIDMGNNGKITNLTSGNVAAGDNSAVTGGAVNTAINTAINTAVTDLKDAGFKIGADSGADDTVKLGETVKYAGDANIKTTVTNNQIGFKLADSITVGPASGGNPVTVDGSAGTVTGLTNKTWNPAGIVSGRAATEDQLKAVTNQVNSSATHYYSVNDGGGAHGGNFNNDGATGLNALAAGVGASAQDNDAVAIGSGTIAQGNGSIAIGAAAEVSGATGAGGIAIGAAATAKNGGTAVGSGADTGNGTALIPGLPNRLNNNLALGDSARVKNDTNFNVALGSLSTAGDADLTAAAYKPNATSVIAGDINEAGVKYGEVSLGGDTSHFMSGSKMYRRLTNLAAGSADTDAVNVSQLKAVQAALQDQAPVAYTKADGTKVYKHTDGNFYDAPNGAGNQVAAADVITSLQNAAGSTTAPTTLANVKDNLADTAAAVTNPTGNDRTTLSANKGHNAATVNDVLNAGFTVQGNGVDEDFVTHGDTVNFVNGQGTVANVSSTGGVTTVKFDTPMTYVDTAGTPATTPSNKVNLVGTGGPVTLGNVAAGAVNATSTDAVNGGQLHNSLDSMKNILGGNATNVSGSLSMSNIGGTGKGTIHDAIAEVNNKAATANAGWKFQVNNGAAETIRPNDTVGFKDGTNIAITNNGKDITIATKPDLVADSLTINGNGPVINGNGINTNGKNIDMGNSGKITNLADGSIAAGSKDAITGGQLHTALNNISNAATNLIGTTQPDIVTYDVSGNKADNTNNVKQAIDKMNNGGIRFFHVNDGTGTQTTAGTQPATEDSSASGRYGTAVGYQANASGESGVAIGKGAQATAKNTISIGTGNIVSGEGSGAIGDPTIITGAGTYTIGNNNGTVSANAAGAFGNDNTLTGHNSRIIGNHNIVNTENTFVVGNNVSRATANSVVLGNNSSAERVHTTVTTPGSNYTFGGLNDANVAGVNNVVGVVSVGQGAAGSDASVETRQIQNVAAGVVSATSTDAINGSQLYHTNQAILNGVNGNLANLGARIGQVEDAANAGTAAAMAMAGLPQAYLPGKSMMAVGGSVYRGESGYAIGYSTISDGGNWIIKGTATGNSRGHYGATAAVGYQW